MLISGKQIAEEIRKDLRAAIDSLDAERKPGLAFLLVGKHAPSRAYVRMKKHACDEVGIHSHTLEFPEDVSEKLLLKTISELNADPHIDGILVQLPLPSHLDAQKITLSVTPDKDVDCFHPINMGKLLIGLDEGFVPCTALAVHQLLQRSNIAVEGKKVVIVGRSNIVGKPLAALLMQDRPGCNGIVTVVHSKTSNLKELCLSADILVAAVGRPHLIKADMVKEGVTVIDVGTNRIEDSQAKKGYRLVGDVDFDEVQKKCAAITPVPGGVGPMTVTMLLHNTLQSFKQCIGA